MKQSLVGARIVTTPYVQRNAICETKDGRQEEIQPTITSQTTCLQNYLQEHSR